MLLYFRLNICNGGKLITLTVFNCKHMAQKIVLYRFCLKSYNIIDFDTFFFIFAPVVCACFYLYTASDCHYHEIHQAVLGKTAAAVHFGVRAPFLGYHCIEITPSSKIISAKYVLSKPQHLRLLHKRKLETISRVYSKQPRQYSSPTPDTLVVCIDE